MCLRQGSLMLTRSNIIVDKDLSRGRRVNRHPRNRTFVRADLAAFIARPLRRPPGPSGNDTYSPAAFGTELTVVLVDKSVGINHL
jgi:hypothetical protein